VGAGVDANVKDVARAGTDAFPGRVAACDVWAGVTDVKAANVGT
jgi:hypothetical protein